VGFCEHGSELSDPIKDLCNSSVVKLFVSVFSIHK
jgi:hypothetical protein